jgi:hypothetical protein
MNPSDQDVRIAMARMEERVKTLIDMIYRQDRVLENQDKILKELVASANQGKGALWAYTAIGGVAGGLIMTLLKPILAVLTK